MPTTFRLQEILDAKGMSQSELARRSGVSFQTVNGICGNRTKQVALSTLDRLAKALGVEPGALIARTRRRK